MKKAQKIAAGFLAAAILVIAVLAAAYYYKPATNIPSGNVLYYREECPHCRNVEAFISEYNVSSAINITQKEVWSNLENRAEFAEVIKLCKLEISKTGVPFFYDAQSKACIMGDVDIIALFKQKLNITEENKA